MENRPWTDILWNTPQWLPVDASVRGGPGRRSPEMLIAVVNQFDVEHCRRYQPDATRTWCNIFAWDVTRALDAELPHWVDPEDGHPCKPRSPAVELTVNRLVDWLEQHGHRAGWRSVNEVQARHTSGLGCPTVATWCAQRGHGHIAVLLPTPDGSTQRIAQAGRVCFSGGTLAQGFGSHVGDVEYWFHA